MGQSGHFSERKQQGGDRAPQKEHRTPGSWHTLSLSWVALFHWIGNLGDSVVFISHLERFACPYEDRAGSTASRWKNLDRGGIPPRGSPLHLSCVLARPRGHIGEADQSHPQCGRQVWLQSQAVLRKAPRGSVAGRMSWTR